MEEFVPMTFAAVENQPEPLHMGDGWVSETTVAQKKIETTVPFMPTNFRGMLECCYELLEWIEEKGGEGLGGTVVHGDDDEEEEEEEEEQQQQQQEKIDNRNRKGQQAVRPPPDKRR